MTATAPRVIATGSLVRLREKQPEDAHQDYQWRRDPELAAYDAAQPLSMSLRAYTSTVVEEIRSPTQYRRSFAIETAEDHVHIGNLMYYGYDATRHEAELGITIGLREYWSRGYGSDAVRIALGYFFGELGMRRIFLHTLRWNDRARRAFKRAGFHEVRDVRRGGYDFVLMEILAAEFAGQQADPESD